MRGAWRHSPSFHVAAYGIGLGLVARLGLGARWSPGVATSGVAWRHQHPPSFCVAGVALGDIHLLYVLCGRLVARGGAWRHPPALCVAGVARGDIHLRGTRGAWRPRPSFGEASVALGDIHAARCCK